MTPFKYNMTLKEYNRRRAILKALLQVYVDHGNGVYFTRSSCKAAQYTNGRLEVGDGPQTILICRVALGRIAPIGDARCWNQQNFPPTAEDYHSAKAIPGITMLETPRFRGPQIHDEFIVYEDHACYPEFAITKKIYNLSRERLPWPSAVALPLAVSPQLVRRRGTPVCRVERGSNRSRIFFLASVFMPLA